MGHIKRDCPKLIDASRQGSAHPSQSQQVLVPAGRASSSSVGRSGVGRGGGRGHPIGGHG